MENLINKLGLIDHDIEKHKYDESEDMCVEQENIHNLYISILLSKTRRMDDLDLAFRTYIDEQLKCLLEKEINSDNLTSFFETIIKRIQYYTIVYKTIPVIYKNIPFDIHDYLYDILSLILSENKIFIKQLSNIVNIASSIIKKIFPQKYKTRIFEQILNQMKSVIEEQLTSEDTTIHFDYFLTIHDIINKILVLEYELCGFKSSNSKFKKLFKYSELFHTEMDLNKLTYFCKKLMTSYPTYVETFKNAFIDYIKKLSKYNFNFFLKMSELYCELFNESQQLKDTLIKIFDDEDFQDKYFDYLIKKSYNKNGIKHILPYCKFLVKKIRLIIMDNYKSYNHDECQNINNLLNILPFDISDINEYLKMKKENEQIIDDLKNIDINFISKYNTLSSYNKSENKIDVDKLKIEIKEVDTISNKCYISDSLQQYVSTLEKYYNTKYSHKKLTVDYNASMATVEYNDYKITGSLIVITILQCISELKTPTIKNLMAILTSEQNNNDYIDYISKYIIELQKQNIIDFVNNIYIINTFDKDIIIDINFDSKKCKNVEKQSTESKEIVLKCHIIKFIKTTVKTYKEIYNNLENNVKFEFDEKDLDSSLKDLINKSYIEKLNETKKNYHKHDVVYKYIV